MPAARISRLVIFVLLCDLTITGLFVPCRAAPPTSSVRISPSHRYHNTSFYIRLEPPAAATARYRINANLAFTSYNGPIAIDSPGTYTVYYHARDKRGNTFGRDSATYILDTATPSMECVPPPGTYDSALYVRLRGSEPCSFYYASHGNARYARLTTDSLRVRDSLSGWVKAIDRAGNQSTPLELSYSIAHTRSADSLQKPSTAPPSSVPTWIDTTPPVITVAPRRKIHNSVFHISFSANEHASFRYSLDGADSLDVFSRPVTITSPGTYTLYYRAEDDFGNATPLDSTTYVLDKDPPQLQYEPPCARYKDPVTLRLHASEPATFFFARHKEDTYTALQSDTMRITDTLDGYIKAVDRAGNASTPRHIRFVIGLPEITLHFSPPGSTFNSYETVSITSTPAELTIFYSFDPLAPKAWFQKYTQPVILPYGNSQLRCFAQTKDSLTSDIVSQHYTVDTLPPSLTIMRTRGPRYDTVSIQCREKAAIHYAITDFGTIRKDSVVYTGPFVIERRDKWRISARARDKAGNVSSPEKAVYVYDKTPPVVHASPAPRTYTHPVSVFLRANEPATIFYTTNGASPDTTSRVYNDSLRISKEGRTTVRFFARDNAGNTSDLHTRTYTIDAKPPEVQFEIAEDADSRHYRITFTTEKNARIHYETGRDTPGPGSPRYHEPFTVKPGQIIRYFAVDSVGNATAVRRIDEVVNPIVAANPKGGIYNTTQTIGFRKKRNTHVYWRILPDETYTRYRDSVHLDEEGFYTLEYYAVTPHGSKSPLHQNKYVLDFSAPIVQLTLQKGSGDTAIVILKCDENATIYYTLDRTNPLRSSTMKVAGNKYLTSRVRISLDRNETPHLTFCAEDAAGNISRTQYINLAKPAPKPNIPAGTDIVYNRPLTVRLSALLEGSRIFYARHGNTPTTDSTMYRKPIPLTTSDTIIAFSIDRTGMRGALDTFVYRIDLPPNARMTIVTDTPSIRNPTVFDASASSDREAPQSRLRFRWDFDGDSTYDTDTLEHARVEYRYDKGGIFSPAVQVIDSGGNTATMSRSIFVRGACPRGMAFVSMKNGHTFCIDKYEWPNDSHTTPRANVTWFEARMTCEQQGKRLCTPLEWKYTCAGRARLTYSYGSRFKKNVCNVDAQNVRPGGSHARCRSEFGVYDMVGNVREWVNDPKGNFSATMGGGYASGDAAKCRQRSPENMSTSQSDIGFRCCK